MNGHLTEGLAGDIAWVIQAYDADPTPAGLKHLSDRAEQSLDLSIIYQPGAKLPTVRHVALFGIDRAMNTALSDRIDAPYWYDTTRYPAYVDIRVKVKDGVLRIIAPRDRAFATQAYSFIFWLTLATVLLTAVAVLFIRNQVRAIERLAAAAEAFGKGAEIEFKPYGAREVRQAGQSFLAMKNRIQRYVDQRTTLLASVSHDLRTPLTRLKLELALAEPGKRVEANEARSRRNGAHDRRVPRLRRGEGRRGAGAGGDGPAARGDQRRRPARRGRCEGRCGFGPRRHRAPQRDQARTLQPG